MLDAKDTVLNKKESSLPSWSRQFSGKDSGDVIKLCLELLFW